MNTKDARKIEGQTKQDQSLIQSTAGKRVCPVLEMVSKTT